MRETVTRLRSESTRQKLRDGERNEEEEETWTGRNNRVRWTKERREREGEERWRRRRRDVGRGRKRRSRLTHDLSDHEDEADDRHHVQPLPRRLPLALAVLLGAAVVMAMLDDAVDAILVWITEEERKRLVIRWWSYQQGFKLGDWG